MTFDAEALLDEYDGDKQILGRMLEIFTKDADQRMPRIRAAIDAGDHRTLMAEAHALKGGLGTFFADEAAATAQQLETMGRDGSLAAAAATFQTLESQVQSLTAALTQLTKS